MIGLWQAVQKGPSEAFGAYARIRIRGAIRDELRRHDWVPRAVRARLRESGIKADLVPIEDYDARYEVTAEQICERRQELAKVFRAIKLLTPRQRYVVLEHYAKGRRFNELAAELGVSEPRISQLHSDALQRLRRAGKLNVVPRDW